MDWKSLPAFLAVARAGSLRGGAEQSEGTHATVRRQIEALEARLGVQLFRRGADGLHLTAAGRALLPQALEAEAALLKGFNAVQGLDREAAGRIRLSADPMTAHFLLAPVLVEFSDLYPDIEIDLSLSYSIDSIARLETDVSIRHRARGRVEDDRGASKRFSFGNRHICCRAVTSTGCCPKRDPKGRGLPGSAMARCPNF